MNLDTASVGEALRLIHDEDQRAVDAVTPELPYIEQAVDLVVDAIRRGGRLIYVGAGTSGRLGILDAAECPPTFGTDPETVQGVIAGGRAAMFQAQEGAEDHEETGAADMDGLDVGPADVVCGIAASRRTPYVVGGRRASARVRGADGVRDVQPAQPVHARRGRRHLPGRGTRGLDGIDPDEERDGDQACPQHDLDRCDGASRQGL